jgi:hypothetical protein
MLTNLFNLFRVCKKIKKKAKCIKADPDDTVQSIFGPGLYKIFVIECFTVHPVQLSLVIGTVFVS